MNFPPPVTQYASYLQGAVGVFMTATVEIIRPGTPVYDPVLGTATAVTAGSGYTGPAQITKSTSAGAVLSGESYSEISTVQVLLPNSATPLPRIEDQVIVVDLPEDPQMVNEVLRVVDVSYGGLTSPYRTLTCTFATATPFNPNA